MNQEEIWKPIKGYEGCYEININGVVRSVERDIIGRNGRTYHIKEKYLKHIIKHGYELVRLCKNSKHRNFLVHHLIAEYFIPNPYNKPYVDHINTNIRDNRIENLRWVTQAENLANPISRERVKVKTGTPESIKKRMQTLIKKQRKNAPKEVFCYTKDGKFVAKYSSHKEASDAIGKNVSTLIPVIDNNHRSAGGHIWSSIHRTDYSYIGRRK